MEALTCGHGRVSIILCAVHLSICFLLSRRLPRHYQPGCARESSLTLGSPRNSILTFFLVLCPEEKPSLEVVNYLRELGLWMQKHSQFSLTFSVAYSHSPRATAYEYIHVQPLPSQMQPGCILGTQSCPPSRSAPPPQLVTEVNYADNGLDVAGLFH